MQVSGQVQLRVLEQLQALGAGATKVQEQVRSDNYPKVVQSNRSGPQREPHLRLTATLQDNAIRSATLPALPHKAVSNQTLWAAARTPQRQIIADAGHPLTADVPNHPHVSGSEMNLVGRQTKKSFFFPH